VVIGHTLNRVSGGPDVDQPFIKLLDGFSFPKTEYSSTLDFLVPLIVQEYASGLTAAYIGRHAQEIASNTVGVIEFLARWVSHGDDRKPLGLIEQPVPGWDYAFGDVYRSMFSKEGHSRVAVLVAAHLSAIGQPGNWSATLNEPLQLRWGDWLLPPAQNIVVETNGLAGTVSLTAQGHRLSRINLEVREGRWVASQGRQLLRVHRHGVSISLLTRDGLAMRDYEDLLERAVPDIDPRMLEVYGDALDLLETYAPEYLPWIARTVHQLFLLYPKPHKVESGSVEHYLGLVHLTAHGEPLPVAELLLHEASHQYMNVAAKLKPLDDGSDNRCYWSPAVETERPIAKIVAAFHAFGNVLRFYRRCAESGHPNQRECQRQEQLLRGWMDHLVPPLRSSSALTEIGNAICRPLMQELGLM
jgi:HEXXH motif-containing protein